MQSGCLEPARVRALVERRWLMTRWISIANVGTSALPSACDMRAALSALIGAPSFNVFKASGSPASCEVSASNTRVGACSAIKHPRMFH